MTYVIGSGCVDVMHKDCVQECPADCIYEGARSYLQSDKSLLCNGCSLGGLLHICILRQDWSLTAETSASG